MPTLDDVYAEIRENAEWLADTVKFYEDRIDALRSQSGDDVSMEMRLCERQRDIFQGHLDDYKATLRVLRRCRARVSSSF